MTRQSWIAKRRIIPPAEMVPDDWPRTIVIPIAGERQECRAKRTPFPGLVIVDLLHDTAWTVELTEKYTLTHERSRTKIARFDSYEAAEAFVNDAEVSRLLNKIRWTNDADAVVAAMQPHIDVFNKLREDHGCRPSLGTAN